MGRRPGMSFPPFSSKIPFFISEHRFLCPLSPPPEEDRVREVDKDERKATNNLSCGLPSFLFLACFSFFVFLELYL